MNNNVSLLISTCNKFSDLWDLHIEFLEELGRRIMEGLYGDRLPYGQAIREC